MTQNRGCPNRMSMYVLPLCTINDVHIDIRITMIVSDSGLRDLDQVPRMHDTTNSKDRQERVQSHKRVLPVFAVCGWWPWQYHGPPGSHPHVPLSHYGKCNFRNALVLMPHPTAPFFLQANTGT